MRKGDKDGTSLLGAPRRAPVASGVRAVSTARTPDRLGNDSDRRGDGGVAAVVVLMQKYRYKGKVIEVLPGRGESCYVVGWRTENGAIMKISSIHVCTTRELAQRRLDEWAKRKGLEVIGDE